MFKLFSVIAFLCAMLLSSVQLSLADYIEPQTVTVKTVHYKPLMPELPEGTYEYAVTWSGLPVASASVEIKDGLAEDPNLISISAFARSSRLVGLFYSLTHLSESAIDRETLTPRAFHSIQRENSRLHSTEIIYSANGEVHAKLWKDKDNKLQEERSFNPNNVMLDPLSAAYYARLAPVVVGEELQFDVFNGKHRFLIGLKLEGKEKITVAGVEREAYRITPTVKKLTDTEGEKRLRSATIWVSADDRRDILKLKSEVFFGTVSAELVKFSAPRPADAVMARASMAPPSEEDLKKYVDTLSVP